MRGYLFIAANEGNRWGGSEFLWSQAAEKLVGRGHRVVVSAKGWDPPVPEVERLRGAGCCVSYRKTPSRLHRLRHKLFPLAEYHRDHLSTIARAVDLIVISQGANTDGLSWMEAAGRAGFKYAVISHLASELWWPDDAMAERAATAYDGASRSYFVSQATLNLSARQFATALPNAKIIRNPFGVRYDAQPAWPANHDVELALACVARLDVAHKGQDLLLRVLALDHWRSRKVRVSLIGTGPQERNLRRSVQELALTNVSMDGHLGDIEGVWARHDALVLPSRYEGMPVSIVEAMLCGRPCIVTDVGGNQELVRDGTNGFIAKAPTLELLDDAMNRAWEQRGHLREMGERAAADVRQWVPADPAEDFARDLEALALGTK